MHSSTIHSLPLTHNKSFPLCALDAPDAVDGCGCGVRYVQVLCYVSTEFGQKDMAEVTSDVDTYEGFYPGLCAGYFFDEGPGTAENTWKCAWSRV